MAIGSPFSALGPTYLVGTSSVQCACTQPQQGNTSYRIRNILGTTQYFTYGTTSAVTSVGPPSAGVPSANTIGMVANSVETFGANLGANSWFIANAVGAFEETPGEGV